MSLVKKSDVKNHLSPRYHKDIHLCRPDIQQESTDFVVEDSGRAEMTIDQRIENALNQSGSASPEGTSLVNEPELESLVVSVARQSASD